MSSFAGFANGIVQTNLTGLVYGNGLTAHATDVDYNTNQFTPTIAGSTTSGITTYTAQNGQFTKIGNRIFFDIEIVFTITTGVGDIQVQSLPFTVNDSNNVSIATAVLLGIDWPNNQGTYLAAQIIPNSTNLVITCYHNTNAPANVQMPSGAGTYSITISGSYQTAI
jgi:hypothetical protein